MKNPSPDSLFADFSGEVGVTRRNPTSTKTDRERVGWSAKVAFLFHSLVNVLCRFFLKRCQQAISDDPAAFPTYSFPSCGLFSSPRVLTSHRLLSSASIVEAGVAPQVPYRRHSCVVAIDSFGKHKSFSAGRVISFKARQHIAHLADYKVTTSWPFSSIDHVRVLIRRGGGVRDRG